MEHSTLNDMRNRVAIRKEKRRLPPSFPLFRRQPRSLKKIWVMVTLLRCSAWGRRKLGIEWEWLQKKCHKELWSDFPSLTFCIFHEKASDISTFDAETEAVPPHSLLSLFPLSSLGTRALARALPLGARALGKIDKKVRKAVVTGKNLNGPSSTWYC